MRGRALVLSCALLSACGGSDDGSPAVGSTVAPPAPCSGAVPEAELPEECRALEATPPPGTDPPEGSAFWDALRIEPLPGQLAAAGNDVAVARTSARLTAVVRPGHRLGVQAVCEGRTAVTVTTEPPSAVAVELPCGPTDGPREIGVEDPTGVAATTTYRITVSAPAPSRWYAAFYEVSP